MRARRRSCCRGHRWNGATRTRRRCPMPELVPRDGEFLETVERADRIGESAQAVTASMRLRRRSHRPMVSGRCRGGCRAPRAPRGSRNRRCRRERREAIARQAESLQGGEAPMASGREEMRLLLSCKSVSLVRVHTSSGTRRSPMPARSRRPPWPLAWLMRVITSEGDGEARRRGRPGSWWTRRRPRTCAARRPRAVGSAASRRRKDRGASVGTPPRG